MASNADERVLTIRQRIVTDPADVQRAKSALEQLREASVKLQQDMVKEGRSAADIASAMAAAQVEINRVGAATTALMQAQEDERRATAQALETQTKVVEATKEETLAIETEISALTRLRDARQRAAFTEMQNLPEPTLDEALGNFQTSRGGGGSGAIRYGALGQIGNQIRALPDVGPSTELANVMRGLDLVIQKTAASGGQLAASLGLAGIAVVGFLVFMDKFKKDMEAAKNLLNAALGAQNNFYRAVQDFTTSEAAQDIEDRTRRQRALQDQVQETQNAIDSAWNQLVSQFGDAGARALESTGNTPLTPLREQLAELQAEASTNEQTIARLTQGMENNAFAANDMAEAIERQTQANLDFIKQDSANQLELLRLARNGTPEQVRDQIQAYQDQIEVTTSENVRLAQLSAQALIAGNTEVYDTYQEQIADNLLAIEDWRYANEQLRDSILPIVEAQERQKQLVEGLKDQTDQYLESLENEGQARQALFETTQAISEETAENLKNLADIEKEARDARFEALLNAEAQRQEEEQKAAADELKAYREHRKRLQDIDDKFNASQARAVELRDADAFHQAEVQRAEETKKENEKYQERLDAIEENLDKQYEKIDKSYDKQLAKIDDAMRKAESKEVERHRKEAAIRQQAYDAAEVQLRNAMNAQTLTYQTMTALAQQTGAATRAEWVNIAQTVTSGLAFVRQGFYNTLMQIARDVSGGGVRAGAPDAGFRWGTGGGNTLGSNQLFYNPAPAYNYNQAQQQLNASGLPYSTLNLNVNGVQERTIDIRSREHAESVVGSVLDLLLGRR